MTLDEFAALVRAMREEQRRFFRTKLPSVLRRCKQLEKQVDAEIENIRRGPQLFEEQS